MEQKMIKNVTVRSVLERDNSTGNPEVKVEMEPHLVEGLFLWAWLADPCKAEIDRIFPVQAKAQVEFCMQAKNVKIWNAETPYLYELVLELRDKDDVLLESVTKKIAFYRWDIEEGKVCLCGKRPHLRARHLQDTADAYDGMHLRLFLAEMKKENRNTLLVRETAITDELRELCHEYGVYLFAEEEWADDIEHQETISDFEMNVSRGGVLIENHSAFVNTDVYDLCYGVYREEEAVSRGKMKADVPAGHSRYLELPFAVPDVAGEYIYRAALCLREETIWAPKGYEVAFGECMISNFYGSFDVK